MLKGKQKKLAISVCLYFSMNFPVRQLKKKKSKSTTYIMWVVYELWVWQSSRAKDISKATLYTVISKQWCVLDIDLNSYEFSVQITREFNTL